MLPRRPLTWMLVLGLMAGCALPPSSAPRATTGWAASLEAGAPFPAGAWDDDEDDDDGVDGFDVLHTILFYIPNRILDVLDIVRARVRLGPGLAVGARATEFADVFAGTYMTVYIGLPGPRGRKLPRLPAGLESRTGVEASVADLTVEGPLGPDYGTWEFGAGLQFLLVGVDVGVEPVEILDLLVGLLTFDIMDDDF